MTLKRALYWLLPSLFCIALYWHGLKAWFQMDDFAWLSLHARVHDFPSLLTTLLQPMAQGTVRPLSERLLFLTFWNFYGMDALPYRILVFSTQAANLILIAAIVRRLTGSALAGLAAPLLWLASPVLYLPMVWTSAYNQILCAFFLLLAFLLLLCHIDTSHKRDYVGMWIAFLLGFGALELNVMFPAVACLYTLLFARRYLRAVAPMFLVSTAFAVWHRSAGKGLANSVYSMDLHPLSMVRVLAEYTWLTASAAPAARLADVSRTYPYACTAIVLAVLFGFAGVMAWKRHWLAVFFVGWYVLTLAPYVPLANHVSDYYLTVPSIGLAMLGGWGFSVAANARIASRATAAIAVLLFTVPCAWQAWTLSEWYAAKSRRLRTLMRGVASAHQRYPERWILLHGVDDDLFWYGLYDKPETPLGWRTLYMTADTQSAISAVRDEDISDRFLPQAVALEAIRQRRAVVYDVSGGRLRNITTPYLRLRSQSDEATRLPRFLDVGNPLFSGYLLDGWHESTGTLRWMSSRASLRMGAPEKQGFGLRVRGRVSEIHTATRPFAFSVYVDGAKIGTQAIPVGTVDIDGTFRLPSDVAGREGMTVLLETDRAVSFPSDKREFGIALGTVAVVPVTASPAVP